MILQGPCDGGDHISPAVQTNQVQQTAQMHGGFDGSAAELQMELPRLFSQGIEGLFDLLSPLATTRPECLQLMFGLTDQLAALVAAHMAGDFLPLVNNMDVRGTGSE